MMNLLYNLQKKKLPFAQESPFLEKELERDSIQLNVVLQKLVNNVFWNILFSKSLAFTMQLLRDSKTELWLQQVSGLKSWT